MSTRTVTEFSPNGFFRQWLINKGYESRQGFDNNEEYLVNKKGWQVQIKYRTNKGIRLINKHGYTLYNGEIVTNEDFKLFERETNTN